LKRSHTRFRRQNQTNLIRQEENLTYSRNNPLFEQKLELATEGLEPYFLKHLKTKISPDNALAILMNDLLSRNSESNFKDGIPNSIEAPAPKKNPSLEPSCIPIYVLQIATDIIFMHITPSDSG
jgi:hypothetical protein